MDILTIIQAVLQRWYVTVPVLVTALGVALYVNSTIPPQYEATGQVLLAGPDVDPSDLPRNIASLGDLGNLLSTDEVRAPLVVGDSSVEVAGNRDSLTIEIASDSAADARATSDNIVAWLDEAVEDRQVEAGIARAERLQLRAESTTGDGETPGALGLPELGAPAGEDGPEVVTIVGLQDPNATTVNPFGATNATARILTIAVQSDEGRQRIAEEAGPGFSFVVGQDARDAAPILTITTSGSDQGAVLDGFGHVSDAIAASLAAREERAEVPPAQRTTLTPLAVPQTVADVSPPLARSVATIIGLGVLLAVAAAITLESVAERRRDRPTTARGDRQGAFIGPRRTSTDAEVSHRPRAGSTAAPGAMRAIGLNPAAAPDREVDTR